MSYAPISKNGVAAAEPLDFPTKKLSISTQVVYRGRTFTVEAEGYTVDRLCDMLDEKFGSPAAAPNGGNTRAPEAPQPLASPPSCPVHRKAMKAMKFAGKRGEQWMCTFRFEDGTYCDERI